ncbi:hypothetical protein GCM10009682_53830 [Luedemannella flava]|uniref:Uncharacterized protein n=1 Tax=Luedemannella flava TaxID=349316 RepID=A0ABN2MKL5_9ACTN
MTGVDPVDGGEMGAGGVAEGRAGSYGFGAVNTNLQGIRKGMVACGRSAVDDQRRRRRDSIANRRPVELSRIRQRARDVTAWLKPTMMDPSPPTEQVHPCPSPPPRPRAAASRSRGSR